jgi:hypothetical protein
MQYVTLKRLQVCLYSHGWLVTWNFGVHSLDYFSYTRISLNSVNYVDSFESLTKVTFGQSNYIILTWKVTFLPVPWPCALMRRSAATRFLALWVWILPGRWTFVSCEYCVLSGIGLCDGPIPHPEETHRVCACVCVSLSVIKCNSTPLQYNSTPLQCNSTPLQCNSTPPPT